MIFLSGSELDRYKKENLQISPDWKHRDFVKSVKNYFSSNTEKILVVGGLRGTGKTVGILQAAAEFDAVYLTAQKGEKESGSDYIKLLEDADKKCIIIDEYSWIEHRDSLDRYLLTAVQRGHRIVLSGTESISLEFLNYGPLCHRTDIIHTTMFTYEEYLRLNNQVHNKKLCKQFLTEGGLFKEYLLNTYDKMIHYVNESIVHNLAYYLKDSMDEEKARTLTYSVLYKAVCPANLSSVPTLRSSNVTLENFLDIMGINTAIPIRQFELNRVADIFEQIGLIVRVPNINADSKLKEQYYITNPSLTCQLILAAYDLNELDNSILGHVFELYKKCC